MKRNSTESHEGNAFINSVRFIDDENIDWTHYPFNIPAVASLTEVSLNQPITIFIGENGTGKSTIIEGLAAMLGINAEGGSKGMSFSTAETHSILWDHLAANRNALREGSAFFLRAETMYNVFTERAFANDDYAYDELYNNKDLRDENGLYIGPDPRIYRRRDKYGNSRMHQMSHGESFFEELNRFRKNGLYILDEPEAALSPNRQLAAVKLLHDLAFSSELPSLYGYSLANPPFNSRSDHLSTKCRRNRAGRVRRNRPISNLLGVHEESKSIH